MGGILKIVVTGPESTGKSAICRRLAEEFGVIQVPEFARIYLEKEGLDYDFTLVSKMARWHYEFQQEHIDRAKNTIILDTDLINYLVWQQVVFDRTDPWLQAQLERENDHKYIITYPDIPWQEDPLAFLQDAIKPAVPRNVHVDEAARRIYFEVNEDDLSIAIGRRGQNARLTSKLLGWKLDISKEQVQEVGFDDMMREGIDKWQAIEGISYDVAAFLVSNGFTSPETFEGVEAKDLEALGFTHDDSAQLVQMVTDFRAQQA